MNNDGTARKKGKPITRKMILSCKGMTVREAAEKHDVSTEGMRTSAKRFGILDNFRPAITQNVSKEELLACVGMEIIDIATKFKRSPSSVYDIINKYELRDEFSLKPLKEPEDTIYTETKEFGCLCGCGRKFNKRVAKGARGLRFFAHNCRNNLDSEFGMTC